jgi:enediyne biosynthesis protein E8
VSEGHSSLIDALTRRELLGRASALGVSTLVASALPLVRGTEPALAADPSLTDATLQAFADTMIPGRKVTRTQLGNSIDPLAIAGVDPLPGAVEADALVVYHHPEVGFDLLAAAFLSDLDTRAALRGADFLHLDFPARVQTCLAGLDFSNPTRLIWEAAAAVPFIAFCAEVLIVNATAADACGYAVMGLPGVAPDGYQDYSYGRKLSTELTQTGSLP